MNSTPAVRRVTQAIREDFRDPQPRLWAALAIGGLLPPYIGGRVRARLLRSAGVTIGARTIISGRVWLAGSRTAARHLTIGDDCFINDGVRFDVAAPVTIGARVAIGHDVLVVTSSHGVGTSDRRADVLVTSEPVQIEDGAWLGARSLVMPGVTIGRGSVVAAGAVVTASVPADTVVAGVPARRVKRLS